MAYSPHFSLQTPAAVSALSFASANTLSVGSDDGSVRLYTLPSTKVTTAIRGLGKEVSSISWLKPYDDGSGALWVASGRTVFKFELTPAKLIFTSQDAVQRHHLGDDEEDVLNEVRVSENKKYLAFTTDGGTVGVLDLATSEVLRMKTSHTSISGSVKFVPERSSELVSGGYDSALLHFDYKQASLLSRYDVATVTPSSGVSLSPAFILSISISPSGLIAATTANGRLCLGVGGDKHASGSGIKKKRSRKWEGLRGADVLSFQIADGPVVASTFTTDGKSLVTCTLLGKITLHQIVYEEDDHKVQVKDIWVSQTREAEKVNVITAAGKWLVIGGLEKTGRGIVEIWSDDGQISGDSILASGIAQVTTS